RENALMSNCHVRIAYAPNDAETADLLSKMTGTTTVVEKKVSRSRGGATVSVSETARPLLTPDECSRLPGAEKDADGRVTKPGHMLIFTAGQPPIYGMQILYFKDPEFLLRARIPAPGTCAQYPLGITDSLYFEREREGVVQSASRTAADELGIDWNDMDGDGGDSEER
ncbi:type IV secretory system conjugative DNA transfer family protein, partial [Desulfovibrio piger]|nr:type IV secretory system conjugative DNA transfer family protein [Desulfovibrio piger]